MSSEQKRAQLALNGGEKLRTAPWPGRGHVAHEEKQAVIELFDQSIQTGHTFGYNGPQEEAFCKEFAEFMGGGYADAVNSGTTAVFVALKALNLKPFSEVVVGAVTDPGGLMPVPLLNCIPVIADAAPGCYNSGPEQIEAMITPLTSAILFAHIAGEPADVEGIAAVAKKHGLPLVEDCAQAHAAKVNGKFVGKFGDIAAFSTMFGKHFCCGGQGGVVYTQKEDLYWSIRRSADRGKPFGLPAGSTNCLGSLNFNMDELGATIGRVQLTKLPMIVEKRRIVAAALIEGFASLKSVSAPPQVPGAEPTYWFLRTRFHKENVTCDKATFCQALIAEGLPVNPEYRGAVPHAMDWFVNRRVFGESQYPWASPEYKGDAKRQFPCPNVNQSMNEHFNIQMHEGWGETEIKDALAILRKVEEAFSK